MRTNISSNSIKANPSKSHEQRLLCCAMLSKGQSVLYNIGESDDVHIARKIVSNFGAEISGSGSSLSVNGNFYPIKELFCGESALCARLFTPVSCLSCEPFVLNGSGTLLKRPIASGFEILKKMGCSYESNEKKVPVYFEKSGLKPGHYHFEGGISSQLISGLIISLPLLTHNSKLIINNPVSEGYIELTIKTVRDFGISIDYAFDNNILNIDIYGNQKYQHGFFHVEGDWSGSVFFIVAAAICGEISILGLSMQSYQPDRKIIDLLNNLKIYNQWNKNTLKIKKSQIESFYFDATDCPDLIPALIILAIFADGVSKIKGSNRLMFKESSRAEVMQNELNKVGINISIDDNNIYIHGNKKIIPANLCTHNDHRIAMAFSILAVCSGTNITIDNKNCVTKSYPTFFNDLEIFKNSIYE